MYRMKSLPVVLAGSLLLAQVALPHAVHAQAVRWCHDYTKVRVMRHMTGTAQDATMTGYSSLQQALRKHGYVACSNCRDLQPGDVVFFGTAHSGFVNQRNLIDSLAVEPKPRGQRIGTASQQMRDARDYERNPDQYANFYVDQSLEDIRDIRRSDRRVSFYEEVKKREFWENLERVTLNTEQVRKEIGRQVEAIDHHWWFSLAKDVRDKEEVRYTVIYEPYKGKPVEIWRRQSKGGNCEWRQGHLTRCYCRVWNTFGMQWRVYEDAACKGPKPPDLGRARRR